MKTPVGQYGRYQLALYELCNWIANFSSADAFATKLQDTGIWKDAPVLKGVTRFQPNSDTKNIMITGGAGFMFVLGPSSLPMPMNYPY